MSYLRRLSQWAGYLVIRGLICVLQALSIEACAVMADFLGWLLGDLLRVRRKTIDENLAHAFPDWTAMRRARLRRQMWSHLFLFVAEVAHVPRKIHDTNWRDYVKLINSDWMVRALLADRPAMLVSAHYGNFELAGYVLGILGFPTYTVARTLDNPYLNDFVNRFRGATGQHIVPKKGGYEQIVDLLARGETLTFLADQYAGAKGCWVDFFSRPASTHKAIALFSLNHDAPMMVGVARRLGRPMQYELEVMAQADPRGSAPEVQGTRSYTQWYTTVLERAIRLAPEQYWWMHRRWKDTRPPARRARASAA